MAEDFTAGDLAAVRDAMNASGRLCRTEVNRRLYAIRRAFKWGRERSLVPASVVADLEVVRGVALGRGRENADPITADPAAVNEIIADLEHRNPRAARIIGFDVQSAEQPRRGSRDPHSSRRRRCFMRNSLASVWIARGFKPIWRFVAETGLGPVTETPPPMQNAAPNDGCGVRDFDQDQTRPNRTSIARPARGKQGCELVLLLSHWSFLF